MAFPDSHFASRYLIKHERKNVNLCYYYKNTMKKLKIASSFHFGSKGSAVAPTNVA